VRARCPSRGTSGSSPRFYPKSWRLTMDEILFYKVGRRRSRKGLKYAKNIYDNSKRLQVAENK